jgi:hypothetical protein
VDSLTSLLELDGFVFRIFFINFRIFLLWLNSKARCSIERMIIMTDDRNKKNERIKLSKKISLIVAGLFLLYVIIGFWVVPPLFKPKLEEQLSGLLGRKVTIAEIKLNPWSSLLRYPT